MITKLYSLFNKNAPVVNLEAEISKKNNRTIKLLSSIYPKEEMAFNDWARYIRTQLETRYNNNY